MMPPLKYSQLEIPIPIEGRKEKLFIDSVLQLAVPLERVL